MVVCIPAGKSLSGTERGEDGWVAKVWRLLKLCFSLKSLFEVVVDGEETRRDAPRRMSSQGEFSDRRLRRCGYTDS